MKKQAPQLNNSKLQKYTNFLLAICYSSESHAKLILAGHRGTRSASARKCFITNEIRYKNAILLLLFLTGCAAFPGIPSKQTVSIPQMHVGTQGVEVSFVDNAPPNEVFENQWFELAFTLENKGAVDVSNGVYGIGLSEDLETQDVLFDRFMLKGKSVFAPWGEGKTKVLRVRARELGPQLERLPAVVSIDACYPYRTEFSTQVCINPELGVLSQPKRVCTPAVQSFTGQGAPVVVTSIDAPVIGPQENPGFITTQFTVHVRNQGGGMVTAKHQFADACSEVGGKDIYDRASIQGTLSDMPLTCSPSEIRVSDADAQVTCTIEGGLEKSRGSHWALLNINLEYGYAKKRVKQVMLKKMFS